MLQRQNVNFFRKAVVITGICTARLIAQESTDVLPLPLVHPRAVEPQATTRALSANDKAQLMFRNTFGARAIGNRMLAAGFDQMRNRPEEWGGGMDAYSDRFASRMGRLMVRNSVRLGTDVALGIDPRYDRCECRGFLARAGHAWKRVLVARSDSGSSMPAYSNFTAAYVTPMITYSWYPDRMNTWDRKLQSGTMYLGWRGVGNMVREFWPEMKRGLSFKRAGN